MSTVKKTQSEIVSDVRICYDEIAVNDSNFSNDADETELDTIIKSKIDEAFNFVYGNAADGLFDKEEVVYRELTAKTGSDLIGTIRIGGTGADIDNILRILGVKCITWPYYVNEFFKINDADAAWVTDAYCGATSDKPAVIETFESTNKILKLYKGTAANEDISIIFIPKPMAATEGDDEGKYTFNDKLYPAIIYYICGLVAVTFGEKERGQEFMEIAVSMMGGKVG